VVDAADVAGGAGATAERPGRALGPMAAGRSTVGGTLRAKWAGNDALKRDGRDIAPP